MRPALPLPSHEDLTNTRPLAVAEETVDRAVKEYNLKPKRGCITKDVQLVGSQGWSPLMFIKLIQQFGLEVRPGSLFDLCTRADFDRCVPWCAG